MLTLLVSWMEEPEGRKQNIQVIEYFAGVARITQMANRLGYQSVAYDLEYGRKKAATSGRRNPLDLNSNAGMVLAIKLILRGSWNDLIGVFALCCSSFVPVNRGTGARDLLVPEGDENIPSVRRSNKLLSRKLVLLKCMHGIIYKHQENRFSSFSRLCLLLLCCGWGQSYWWSWWYVLVASSYSRTLETQWLQLMPGLCGL